MSDFRIIPLTRGLEAVVDVADYEALSAFKWHASAYGYACRSKVAGQSIYMHRIIVGATRGQFVDHANRNPLDNRRGNLRICTASENQCNKTAAGVGAVAFKGVHRRADTLKFRAIIKVRGRRTSLGQFDTAEEAALAYDVAAQRLHGEFACVNFPGAR